MNKSLLTIITVAVLGIVAYFSYLKPELKEGFLTSSRQVKVEKVFQDPNTNSFFQVPNYQGILSPRFSNADVGPYLRNNLPDYNRIGVPRDPLQASPNPPDPLNVTYELFTDSPSGAKSPRDLYAESDQDSFLTKDGQMKQPIVYDRFIYANRNSRLRGQGDPIRGDLPITPISGNWFVPAAAAGYNIGQTLQQGAMNVLGGVNNETGKEMASLIYQASGRTNTTIGGVDLESQLPLINSGLPYSQQPLMGAPNRVTSFP